MRRALFVLLLAGCGGGSAVHPQCKLECDRNVSCGLSNDPNCQAGCQMAIGHWRDTYRDAYFACMDPTPLSCVTDPATCAAMSEAAQTTRPVDNDYMTACFRRKAECADIVDPDRCRHSIILSEAFVSAARACLMVPCDQANSCLTTAYTNGFVTDAGM